MKEREYLIVMRNERGLTQRDVSQELGISESYYNLIENGSRQKNMSVSILLGLSKVMKVSIKILINKEINFIKELEYERNSNF